MLRVGDLQLDPVTRRVTRGDVEIGLTPKEHAILEILMRQAGQVVTRSRIGDAVWPDAPDNITNLVDVHLSNLRRKINVGAASAAIHTVRGYGFRLDPSGE
jgi:DNA-binding response OmpR family regulator